MARLSRISEGPSIFSSESLSRMPEVSRRISLAEALLLVSEGGMEGNTLHKQAPKELSNLLDEVGQEMFKAPFTKLSRDRQAEVCRRILTPRQLSLAEALKLVIEGQMEGTTLYEQAPQDVRSLLDHLSSEMFQKPFSQLSNDLQGEACRELISAQTMSIEQALRLVVEGKMEGRRLYDQSPKEFCASLDGASQETFGAEFKKLTRDHQSAVCNLFLEAALEGSTP